MNKRIILSLAISALILGGSVVATPARAQTDSAAPMADEGTPSTSSTDKAEHGKKHKKAKKAGHKAHKKGKHHKKAADAATETK